MGQGMRRLERSLKQPLQEQIMPSFEEVLLKQEYKA